MSRKRKRIHLGLFTVHHMRAGRPPALVLQSEEAPDRLIAEPHEFINDTVPPFDEPFELYLLPYDNRLEWDWPEVEVREKAAKDLAKTVIHVDFKKRRRQ